ncbi:MAG: hypothetical protein ACR2M3_01630 [Thermomicrobiales bacterium]
MVRKKVEITTTVTRTIGPYQGKLGTSNDSIEVIISTLYDFGEFSVYVAEIPARLDQKTGSYYLRGPVALRLNNKVNEIVEEVRRKQQAEPETLQCDTPLRFELKAPDFLSGAA